MSWAPFGIIAASAAVLFVLCTLVIGALERRRHPLARSVRGARNLVIPLLAVALVGRLAMGWAEADSTARVVETLLWIAVIHVALSFVNQGFFLRRDGTADQTRVPKLFLDILRGFLVLVGACIVLATVWGYNLGSLFTALGVTSIVLGLALQNTLDNVMAGIALLFERPFNVGDWIAVGDKSGQVTEVNWRSVRVRTRNHDFLIIPNSVLNKEILVNNSRPTRLHGEDLQLGFSYDDPPNKVKRVLLKAARATRGVLVEPSPIVRTRGYGAYSVDYQVKLFIDDHPRLHDIIDEFMTQVWYAARRNGLTIPFPTQTSYEYRMPLPTRAAGASPSSALAHVPFFVPMSPEELASLANDTVVFSYGRGERIVHQGEAGDALFIVREGTAIVTIADAQGSEREVARLGRGEFFGEMALLTGEPRTASVTALEDVEAMVIYKDALQGILARRPGLAQEMAEIVEARRQGLRAIAEVMAMPAEQRAVVKAATGELVARIKRFLGL